MSNTISGNLYAIQAGIAARTGAAAGPRQGDSFLSMISQASSAQAAVSRPGGFAAPAASGISMDLSSLCRALGTVCSQSTNTPIKTQDISAVQASSPGSITYNGGDESERLYRRRLNRTAEWMELRIAARIEHAMAYSEYVNAASLNAGSQKALLAGMPENDGPEEISGNAIVDLPTRRLRSLAASELEMLL